MRAAWLIVLAACGRIGFDATADGAGDADLAAGPFSAPAVITPLASGADEQEATFTADRLELIYRGGTLNNGDLFVSHRASTSDPWGPPTLISELTTASDDTTPALAPDGLTLWFASTRPPSLAHDIWVSTRPDRSSPWGTATNLASLDTAGSDETSPMVDATGMWFNRFTGSDLELFHATGTAPANFTSPQPVDELNSTDYDASARTWTGGLRVVFNSSRPGSTSYDLWEASRDSLSEPFTNLAPISELDVAGKDDWDMWISDDGHYAVFGSNRSGNHDLYEVSR